MTTHANVWGCAIVLACSFGLGQSAGAQQLTVTAGTVVNVFADPSDFVVEMDKAGRCGSKYFHIQRAKANFKEVTAVMLTAFTAGKTFTGFIEGCAGDRNILSHGEVSR
ncbi:hypothetical protein [Xanthobacter flavus]|uniref:hypothetical protein n=1 Tax=Xanthobacter flavus TaxID=281 RepID=UPI0037278739